MQPLVSICIPVYNGESYLHECIESARSQSYKNIEIIIIDDGSSDKSIDIVKEFALQDNRIKHLINKKNLGLVGNWNECIHKASGEWIKFLFQDDLMESNCIETFVKYAEKATGKKPLLVSKRRFLISQSLNEKEGLYYSQNIPSLERIKTKLQNNIFDAGIISNTAVRHMAMNFIGEPTSVMFKKEVTNEVGYYDESLEQICDLEFCIRIASVYGIVYIPDELTSLRIHTQSTTTSNLERKYYSMAFLEPVKLAHLYIFNKMYSKMREQLSSYSLLKLKLYFYIRGYEAFLKAKKNVTDMNSFNLAGDKFPNMALLKKESLLRKLFYQLILVKRNLAS